MEQDENSYKIYLDVCCFNRPFDNWNQERVCWEGEAVLNIMERIRDQKWEHFFARGSFTAQSR